MNHNSILRAAIAIYGGARFVTEITGIFKPNPETRLEVKHDRDGEWRPLATLHFAMTNQPILEAHPRALAEDLRRADTLFDVMAHA